MENGNFSCKNAERPQFPILLSVPHGGRDYPPELIDNCRVPVRDLIRLEDRYADLLIRGAQEAGFTTIAAHRARGWMDLNRAEGDLDRGMISEIPDGVKLDISVKQRGGLGLIPRRLSQVGDIWKRPISYAEAQQRVDDYHRPYHETVSALLGKMRGEFGSALLLDIHSMPPVTNYTGDRRPDFVVGDRFGGSAASRFAEILQAQIGVEGYQCGLNHPYAGDYILRRHGMPRRNIHALQLETCRSLYLDTAFREPAAQLGGIQRLITGLSHLLAQAVDLRSEPLAAE